MDAQETRIFITVLIGLLILGVFVVFFVITMVKSHERKLVVVQAQLLEQMTSLEAERARIARDLHDSFSGTLATIKLLIQNVDYVSDADAAHLQKATALLDIVHERVRNISMLLTPQILERKGLLAAITDLAEDIHTASNLRIKVLAEQTHFPFKKDVEIHLYRIVQEMITNAMKHSAATDMTIHVRLHKNRIVLVVQDNGRGFTVPERNHLLAGFGLQSISSRVALLQGRLQLETQPGKGTKYTLELPTQTI